MNFALRTQPSRLACRPFCAVPATLFALSTLFSTSASSLAAPASAPTFKSQQGYTIAPPAGFRKVPYGAPVDVMFVQPNGASFNVIVTPATSKSLEQVRAQALKLMPGMMSGFKMLSKGSTKVGGSPALTISSTFQMGSPPQTLRLLSVMTNHGGKNYTFSCVSRNGSYARYAPVFQKSLSSLRWAK